MPKLKEICSVRLEHRFKQAHRGRPGSDTAYRKITRQLYDIECNTDQAAIAYDQKSDGMYPLLANDRKLSPSPGARSPQGPA